MKNFKFLSSAIIMLMLFSCNSGGNGSTTTTTDSTMKDSTAMMPPPPPAMPAPSIMTMLIKQKVANFAKWLAVYEGHDSARTANGLHNYVIGRGLKDSNTVLVALRMDDTAKAKQFGMSPGLMAAMKKGGVMGKPTVLFNTSKYHDSTTDASTERGLVTFKVKDYDTWKKGFDSDEQQRKDAGMSTRAINVDINDPNKVTLVMVIGDMKKTEAFMQTKELKHRMDSSGVIGAPDAFFYHVVKQY